VRFDFMGVSNCDEAAAVNKSLKPDGTPGWPWANGNYSLADLTSVVWLRPFRGRETMSY